MSTHEAASRFLNELAHGTLDAMDAGAVVILALVTDDDGELCIACGSTGYPEDVKLVTKSMTSIGIWLGKDADRDYPTAKSIKLKLGGVDEN